MRWKWSTQKKEGTPPPVPCGGFTLVELLVSLAILALLAAVLCVSFVRARQMAQETACRSNLRAWGAAFHAYALDHKGFFPHTDDVRRSDKSGLADSPHNHCYIDELPPYMGDRPWREYPNGEKPKSGFWQCPAAKVRPDKEYNYSPSKAGYHSYAMNSYLAHDFDYGMGGHITDYRYSYLNLAMCESPAQTILLFEQTVDPRGSVLGNRFRIRAAGYQTAEDVTALSVRHRRILGKEGGNLLFVDGHVQWRDEVWAKQRSDIPARNDLEWYPFVF
ncbi:MAG: prepilin-type N-terminal cleavage/methylation domain-containing protein [Verrucomicrobiota bacterium]|jgi:prepilin-type N-terminal cleavage/methylation domain-containing protein/prepilin-type processing-associated H-X9-DG protein|nr:prepilin-type N-terminal cleavage/methylation domain-containing protein [Verrucomicrobiota bacterium]